MQSIFDIIEEHKEKPEVFAWLKPPPHYNSSESFYESTLTTLKPSGMYKVHRYILTFQGLFKLKASSFF